MAGLYLCRNRKLFFLLEQLPYLICREIAAGCYFLCSFTLPKEPENRLRKLQSGSLTFF